MSRDFKSWLAFGVRGDADDAREGGDLLVHSARQGPAVWQCACSGVGPAAQLLSGQQGTDPARVCP